MHCEKKIVLHSVRSSAACVEYICVYPSVWEGRGAAWKTSQSAAINVAETHSSSNRSPVIGIGLISMDSMDSMVSTAWPVYLVR